MILHARSPVTATPRGAVARRLLSLALAGTLAAGGAAACGEDDKPPQAGADLTEMRCPLASTGEVVGGVEQYAPAKSSFDTAELIGKRLEDARARAAEAGCVVVVSIEDGKGLPVSTEINPKQIAVYTEKGVVSQIEGVGGGF